MIRKSGYRFSLATNAERVCAEIMLKSKKLACRRVAKTFSTKNKTGVNIHVHRKPLRLCAIAARWIAGAGSAVDRPCQIQLRRRQQRPRPGSGRRPDRRD